MPNPDVKNNEMQRGEKLSDGDSELKRYWDTADLMFIIRPYTRSLQKVHG